MSSASLAGMDTMTISVRLFAILRERAGQDRIALELDPGSTVDDALAALAREPGLAEPLDRMAVAMAVNRDYAAGDTELHAGDELALIPPVSGGAAEVHDRAACVHEEAAAAGIGDVAAHLAAVKQHLAARDSDYRAADVALEKAQRE